VQAGTIHHIAFRVKDDATQMAFHEKISKMGLHITPQIDRNYFHSLYFREPGGVLFEIATDNPGFTVMIHWKNWAKILNFLHNMNRKEKRLKSI
jgi:glyoxalase family protein